MDRRRFLLTSLAGALATPLAVEAHQAGKLYRIGVIVSARAAADAVGPDPRNPNVAALVHGLRDLGYVYARHYVTEPRSTEGRPERSAAIAVELAKLKVDVIVVGGPALFEVTQANIAVPVVMAGAPSDPVHAGLVASLARPGGNITGMSLQHSDLDRKRLQLLTEVVPSTERVAVLRGQDTDSQWKVTEDAARLLARRVLSLEVRRAAEITHAFRSAVERRAGALIVIAGALLDQEARHVVGLASQHRLPAMYSFRNFYIEEGGLISYGVDLVDIWRRAADYVDKILRGAKPADLPVEQPTKFELVINAKTAKALGLTIPPSFLARADQVIE